MSKSKVINLKVGQTVTTDIMEQAEVSGLPPAAMAELWPKRTLNKTAMDKIEKAVKRAAPKKQAETKESKS